jgi:hypothetical protein
LESVVKNQIDGSIAHLPIEIPSTTTIHLTDFLAGSSDRGFSEIMQLIE